MTKPVLLIAEREFRTYIATLSFWLSLAIAPLAAGMAVLLSGSHVQPVAISIQGGDARLARSARTALEEAGRLEGHAFVFTPHGASLLLSASAPQAVEMRFSEGFPLSPEGRALVGHVVERDMARSRGSQIFAVRQKNSVADGRADAGRLSRLVTMTMLWLTLTGSLGMLLQAIARERANRALESLRASARDWEIVTGKLLGVGAVSLLILTTWLGSAAVFSIFLPSEAGLAGSVLAQFAHPLTLLRDALIYLCAFGFYGAATLVVGAMARDSTSAQNLARPLFLLLLAAFFVALAAPAKAGALGWLVYLPPLTPFLLLVNSAGDVATMSQALLLITLLLASVALMLLSARLLSLAPNSYHIFKRDPGRVQPMV